MANSAQVRDAFVVGVVSEGRVSAVGYQILEQGIRRCTTESAIHATDLNLRLKLEQLVSINLRTAIPGVENAGRFGSTLNAEADRIVADFGMDVGAWNISVDGVEVDVSIEVLRGLLNAAFQILVDVLRAQIQQVGQLSTPGTSAAVEPQLALFLVGSVRGRGLE
ncbi:uncharacterized protein BDZ99DRAFT_220530 [Mytilinidion resinicola]|uniref:Uncharacterized protein n=1 Tax=Mytilinidion resinicola TaxID=574789 RepID=A0A6A6Y0T3_9PEZI|nr:uncharacterized protein BDZ99DRAFT_220530 [Mytilinidion resinicola]KAF2801417.1 hypothetical protein BDZ99DRAFT_220530 [Mytilinidion resinicola]